MLATIVNGFTIIVGGLVGVALKHGIKANYKDTIMDAIALAVIVLGISGAIKSQNIILMVFSLVVGALIGETLKIEKRLENLGATLQKGFKTKDANFSKGFISASLVFCVGAMAIVGSLEAGISNNYDTLYAKSILDGITALIFASTLGVGVVFSALPVFIYQGLITLLAQSLSPLLSVIVINELSAVGGVLILAIGVSMLGVKKINVANLLPAIFIPIIYYAFLSAVF